MTSSLPWLEASSFVLLWNYTHTSDVVATFYSSNLFMFSLLDSEILQVRKCLIFLFPAHSTGLGIQQILLSKKIWSKYKWFGPKTPDY